MSVRSRRLFGPVANGAASQWNVLYTVPAGRTARFSLFTVTNASGNARLLRVGIIAAGIDNYIAMMSVPANSSIEILRGLVLNPADQVEVYVDGANQLLLAGFGSLLLGAPE